MPGQGVLIGAEDLDSYTINNFAPGIVLDSSIYGTQAPLGSASQAIRCYSRPGIGLRPFPSYVPILDSGQPTFRTTIPAATTGFLAIGDIQVFGYTASGNNAGGFFDDIATTAFLWNGTNSEFGIENLIVPGKSDPPIPITNNLFLDSAAGNPTFYNIWPNLAKSFMIEAGAPHFPEPSVFSMDPANGANSTAWVAVGSTTVTGTNTITIPAITAFITDRFVIIGAPPSAGFGTLSGVVTSDLQSPTNFTPPEYFEPELGSPIGAWGTISTGEFIMIFQNGGAVIVYGDIQAPQQAIYLPAVTGTGLVSGPGVSSPVGLVYVTDNQGAWVWNGGNVSQKISTQIPDALLYRSPPVIVTNPSPKQYLFGVNQPGSFRADVWGNWVMFANNYFFDCLNNSWWQCEDTSILNFDIHSGGSGSGQYFYSIPNTILTTLTGGVLSTSLYRWDSLVPANSYTWQSNPIPTPGSVSRLQRVEIVASNDTPSPATIAITPTSPPGQSLYGNQTASAITFTVPPHTASYRNSQQIGYTDYNICLKVIATGGNNTSAPTIHEITCGFNRSSSRVSQ